MSTRVVLFDADGVIVVPDKPFAVQYADLHQINFQKLLTFFKGDFTKALVGEADLKELLEKNRDVWQFSGNVRELMKQWFEAENIVDSELVVIIEKLKSSGIKCCLATNQEKYRTKYLKDVMFPGLFDKIFSSAEIGHKKPDLAYFDHILDTLSSDDVTAKDIVYFDDDVANISNAATLGIHSFLYKNIEDAKRVLESIV